MNLLKHTPKAVALICFSFLILSPSVKAQSVINVKVGTTTNNAGVDGVYNETGQAVLGGSSGFWNEFSYVSTTPFNVELFNNSNSDTGAQISIANSTGTGVKTTTSGINPAFLFNNQPYQNAGGVFTISFSSLQPDTDYLFVGYGSRTSSGAGALWAVTDGTYISGTTSNGTSMDITTGNGNSYSEFTVETDDSGFLTVTDSGNPGGSITALAGVQLQQTPEPSTYALLGLGALALVIMYRRKAA
jgi:hypothetical protein